MNKYAASMLMSSAKNPAFSRQAALLSALSTQRATGLV